MKKTYKNPTLTVVDVEYADILAGSFNDPLGDNPVDGGAALGHEATFSDWGGDEYVIDDEAMNIGF